MKPIKTECPICRKKKTIKTWIARKGILKGHTISQQIICRPLCYKKFKLIIMLNDVYDSLEEVNNKIKAEGRK